MALAISSSARSVRWMPPSSRAWAAITQVTGGFTSPIRPTQEAVMTTNQRTAAARRAIAERKRLITARVG